MIRLLTQQDQPAVMEYLAQEPFGAAFLFGNVLRFGLENDRDQQRCGDYYGYFSKGKLAGILPFYNIGSCIPIFDDDAAIEPFAEIMSQRQFEGLLGMQKFIKPLYDRLADRKETVKYQESSYFVNNKFVPFSIPTLTFADIGDVEEDYAVRFVKKAYEQGFGHNLSLEETRKLMVQRTAEEDFIFLLVQGEIVAQANIQAFTDKLNQIGGVYTPEEERGNGYCKAIVSEICRRVIARGKTPTLMVRNDNTPAVRAYAALGFSHYDDYLIIKYKV